MYYIGSKSVVHLLLSSLVSPISCVLLNKTVCNAVADKQNVDHLLLILSSVFYEITTTYSKRPTHADWLRQINQ